MSELVNKIPVGVNIIESWKHTGNQTKTKIKQKQK